MDQSEGSTLSTSFYLTVAVTNESMICIENIIRIILQVDLTTQTILNEYTRLVVYKNKQVFC